MTLPEPYYQSNGIVLYCGDNREILPELGRFDLLLTDPPYLYENMKGAGFLKDRAALRNTNGFTDMGFDSSILDTSENWFCFCCRNNLVDVIGRAAGARWAVLHWFKTNPVPTCNNTYLSDVEYCVHKWSKGRLFGEMKDKSLFELRQIGQKETSHPNEKPIMFIRRLVRLGSQVGDTICDPFAGSGTTLLAAKLEGRRAVGIEISFCQLFNHRIRSTKKPPAP